MKKKELEEVKVVLTLWVVPLDDHELPEIRVTVSGKQLPLNTYDIEVIEDEEEYF